jgi:1-aminocyclopropane-1-carboxylate deaminase
MTPPALDQSLLQPISCAEAAANNISVDVLRLDLIHPVLSGNKWFKLNGHLEQAQRSARTIITFGGAWSNHLVATAYAAREAGLTAIGIVRGERPATLSATLTSALDYGMRLEFVSRGQYKEKTHPDFLDRLYLKYPGAYIIPEGGAGPPGIAGSEQILQTIDSSRYTHILCAIGTGTMFLGLIRSSVSGQTVVGVPVLKGIDPISEADPHLLSTEQKARAQILAGYQFGGYARHPPQLLDFMNDFYQKTSIPSDIVYTGKLFYAACDTIRKDYYPTSARLLLIHSGGLQGNASLPREALQF